MMYGTDAKQSLPQTAQPGQRSCPHRSLPAPDSGRALGRSSTPASDGHTGGNNKPLVEDGFITTITNC